MIILNKKGEKQMAKVVIDYEKCDGADCGECADVCGWKSLYLKETKLK